MPKFSTTKRKLITDRATAFFVGLNQKIPQVRKTLTQITNSGTFMRPGKIILFDYPEPISWKGKQSPRIEKQRVVMVIRRRSSNEWTINARKGMPGRLLSTILLDEVPDGSEGLEDLRMEIIGTLYNNPSKATFEHAKPFESKLEEGHYRTFYMPHMRDAFELNIDISAMKRGLR
tara:strand:- start:1190 stop:1714 length:525 start_codon:yes stop_codon:yes gene_type:complete